MTEITVRSTSRKYQIIVLKRRIRLAQVVDQYATLRDVDTGDFCHGNSYVALLAKQVTNRRSDVARREGCGRDLIEQRLKEMMIALIDQSDRKRRVPECFCCIETCETTADNDNMWTF